VSVSSVITATSAAAKILNRFLWHLIVIVIYV